MVTVAPPDTWVYALRLPHDPRAARVARMTVRAVLNGHGMREVLDVVELLTSELVTNAYQYAKGPASLRLTALGGGRLRGCGTRTRSFPRPSTSLPATGGDRLRWTPSTGVGCSSYRRGPIWWGGDALGQGAGKLLWFEVGGGRRDGLWHAVAPRRRIQ